MTEFKILTSTSKEMFEKELTKLTDEGWLLLSREALIVTEKKTGIQNMPSEPRYTVLLHLKIKR